MASSRRDSLLALMLAPLAVAALSTQDPQEDHRLPLPSLSDEDKRMPNGKSQRDAIAKQQHADALKDVDALVSAAEGLRDELKRAGDYVVPVTSLRKTEEIEKLAKRIRGRLKN